MTPFVGRLSLFVISFLVVITQGILPSVAATSQEVHTFCSELHAQLKNPTPSTTPLTFGTLLHDLLKIVYAPRQTTPLKALREHSQSIVQLDQAPSKNIIFSFESPYPFNSEKFDASVKELKKLRRIFKKLRKTTDVQECVQVATEKKFQPKRYAELRSFVSNRETQLGYASEHVRDLTLDALAVLRLPWDIKHVTHLADVFDALHSPDVENVVILTHTQEHRMLLDSYSNEYPIGFFAGLSPALRTLTLYACHGSQLPSVYRLKSILHHSPTIHPLREIYYTPGTTLLNTPDQAPAQAIPDFLSRVESRILELQRDALSKPSHLPIQPNPAQCELQIPGFEASQGTFAWILNDRTIGLSSPQQRPQSFLFPCSYLDSPPGSPNILVNRSIQFERPAELAHRNFDIRLSAGPFTINKLKHFDRLETPAVYESSKAWINFQTPGN